jgi:hypothetical protein
MFTTLLGFAPTVQSSAFALAMQNTSELFAKES